MKLSEVKYHNIFGKDNDFVEGIVFDNTKQNLDVSCDVGIVFGGISMIPYRVERAWQLYEEGMIQRILLTGGIGVFNHDRKIPEAHKMEQYLLQKGVPQSDILVEDKSVNTRENIQNFMEILQKEYNLDDASLALITSDFHMRRCLALMEMYYRPDLLYGSGVKDGITDIDNWYNSFYGKRLILTEALFLCHYAKKGVIPDLEVNDILRR